MLDNALSCIPLAHHYRAVLALGSLRFAALWFLDSGGKIRQKFKEEVFFQGYLCFHGVDLRIRLQEQNFLGNSLDQLAQKLIFDCVGQGCR